MTDDGPMTQKETEDLEKLRELALDMRERGWQLRADGDNILVINHHGEIMEGRRRDNTPFARRFHAAVKVMLAEVFGGERPN